jgi:hypothetical protein
MMKRLPDNFRPAMDEIKKSFQYNSDMSYNEVNKRYRNINNIFKKHNCESYDVNNVLHHYHIDNNYQDTVKNMRMLTVHRNKDIIRKLKNNKEKWIDFIVNTRNEMNEVFDGHIDLLDIHNSMFDVMHKYKDNWLGFWSIINVNNSGNIKNIQLFDIDDIDSLKKILKKKYKLKTQQQIRKEEDSTNIN